MSPTRNQTFPFVNDEFVIIVLEQVRLPSLYSRCCLSCLSCRLSFLLLLYGPHICCSSRGIIFQFSFHLACSLHCASLSLVLHFGVRKQFSVADRHYSGSLIHRCLVIFFYAPLKAVNQLSLPLHLVRFIHTVSDSSLAFFRPGLVCSLLHAQLVSAPAACSTPVRKQLRKHILIQVLN